jgi:hypothetical protein
MPYAHTDNPACSYITPGKKYYFKAFDDCGRGFSITDDDGDPLYCNERGCDHIEGDWIITESEETPALLSSGYTKGNGELVEAVRPALDWLDRYIDEFGELCSDGDDAVSAYEAARNALSDSEGVAPSGRSGGDGWQPIETAPKDGTDLLVCAENDCGDGSWETKYWVDWQMDAYEWPHWEARVDLPNPPAHWMPLPTPPAQGTQRAERATNGDHHDEG